MRRFTTFLAGIIAAALSATAAAQSWPQKPVRLINPFPPGGGTDTFARPLAARLSQAMGQQVIIDNRGGAGGTLGAACGARGPATVTCFSWVRCIIRSPQRSTRSCPIRLERDFVPLAVIVHRAAGDRGDSPKTPPVKNRMKRSSRSPRRTRASSTTRSAGNGTSHHLGGRTVQDRRGVDLTHVPYKGAGPALQDLIAGQVDVMFDGLGSSARTSRAGLRPLAVTTATRSAPLPDVPTAGEAGVKGYELTTWYAVWAVRGTPQPIVDRMYQEIAKALQSPEIKLVWDGAGRRARRHAAGGVRRARQAGNRPLGQSGEGRQHQDRSLERLAPCQDRSPIYACSTSRACSPRRGPGRTSPISAPK